MKDRKLGVEKLFCYEVFINIVVLKTTSIIHVHNRTNDTFLTQGC